MTIANNFIRLNRSLLLNNYPGILLRNIALHCDPLLLVKYQMILKAITYLLYTSLSMQFIYVAL